MVMWNPIFYKRVKTIEDQTPTGFFILYKNGIVYYFP